MSSTAKTTRAYPKRKRAEVSYYESASEEGEGNDGHDNSDEHLTPAARKKLKTSSTSVSTKPLPKRKIFPFMSLPAELKNQIYALALTDLNSILLASKTKRYRRTVQRFVPTTHNNRIGPWHLLQRQPSDSSADSAVINMPNLVIEPTLPRLVPNMLLLNRAIYAETQPILYAGNTFVFEDIKAMHAFLATIGSKNRATIADLTVRGWGLNRAHHALNHAAFTMLAGAVNLTRLCLDCEIHWSSPQRTAKQLYRDGFHWLEAMGSAKGRVDAAVDIIEVSDGFFGTQYQHMRATLRSPEEKMEDFRAELRQMLSR